MKINIVIGIILIILSILFFGIFIWWGTTSYNANYAFGIILVATGTFVSGMYSLYNSTDDSYTHFDRLYDSNNDIDE